MTAGTIGIGYAPVPSAPEHWMERGTCTTMDPRIWDDSWTLATTYCNRCPVLDECREWVLGDGYALTKGEGLIAGLDPIERDKRVREKQGKRPKVERAVLPPINPETLIRPRRYCWHCDQPLPADVHGGMKVHPGCRPEWDKKRAKELQRDRDRFTKPSDRPCEDCGEIMYNAVPRKILCDSCAKERNRINTHRWRHTCKECGYISKTSIGKARLCAECKHLNSIRQREDAK